MNFPSASVQVVLDAVLFEFLGGSGDTGFRMAAKTVRR